MQFRYPLHGESFLAPASETRLGPEAAASREEYPTSSSVVANRTAWQAKRIGE